MRPPVKSKIIRLVALRYHKLLAARSQRKKARRTSYPRQDYKNSVWWHFINKPTIQDPDHRDGKLFRTRFRVPYEVYKQLLYLCQDGPLAKHILQEGVDSSGRPAVPLELKLLGVLRVLGRASCFDSIAELTGTNEEVHRTFFHKFLSAFVAELCDVYICPPHSADGIARVMKAYDAIGFTGCIGSVDCVHIPWGRCPAGKSNLYTGKEGFPTVAYQVVCDHTLRIMSVTSGHYGTRNDKTIVKFDSFVNNIRRKVLFAEVDFELYTKRHQVVWAQILYSCCSSASLS